MSNALPPNAQSQAKEPDYEAMAREQRALAATIREHGGGAPGGGGAGQVASTAERLLMRVQVGVWACGRVQVGGRPGEGALGRSSRHPGARQQE
jgi:hypothetical protein